MANANPPDFVSLKTTAKTVSTNSEQILRENGNRRYLIIQNNGSAVAYVGFGSDAGPGGSRSVSSTTGIKITNGQELEFTADKGNLSSEVVYATSASTNTALLITEGAYSGEFAAFAPPAAGASSSSSSSSPSSASSASSESSSSSSPSSASSASSESSSSP